MVIYKNGLSDHCFLKIYLFERQSVHTHVCELGEGQRERMFEQTLCWAPSPMWGSISQPMRSPPELKSGVRQVTDWATPALLWSRLTYRICLWFVTLYLSPSSLARVHFWGNWGPVGARPGISEPEAGEADVLLLSSGLAMFSLWPPPSTLSTVQDLCKTRLETCLEFCWFAFGSMVDRVTVCSLAFCFFKESCLFCVLKSLLYL